MLQLGELCPMCVGSGNVLVNNRPGVRHLLPCPTCAHVRAGQLALNASAAGAIARGLRNLDNFDIYGEELRHCGPYHLDAPSCVRRPIVDATCVDT